MSGVDGQRILTEWNTTSSNYPADVSVVDLFESQAIRARAEIAVVHDGVQLSYEELDIRSSKLANFLLKHQVGPESIVGLCVDRSPEMIVGLLGILKAGAALLPLDPNYPGQRLSYIIADAKPQIVLTQRDKFTDSRTSTVMLDADWAAIDGESGRRPPIKSAGGDLAYVIYTSGSSGKPKGVMVQHSALANQMQWMCSAFPLHRDDVVLQKTPLIFDAGIWEILAPLLSGAKLVMAKPGAHANPRYLVEAIRSYGVTTVQFVPSMLRLVLEEANIGMCTSLRNIFCGGEVLTTHLRDKIFKLFDAGLHNLYGPTETCIQCTSYSCNRDDNHSSVVPIGRPIANTQAYVLDEQLEPVAIGAEGELYIGGAGLARGYLGRSDLTRESFIANPLGDPGSLIYRTGDRVRYLIDGNLEFVGRADSQIKLGGHRIELGEIEAALMMHPDVREAAVTAVDDSVGLMRLIAYIVDAGGGQPQAHELRDYLRQFVPDSMIPASFIYIPQLPRMAGGKIDRNALSADTPFTRGTRDSAPMSEAQSALAEIWQHALEVTDVGLEDDFFDLGGSSMKLIFVFAKANERFGTSVDVEAAGQGTRLVEMASAFDQPIGNSTPIAVFARE